MPLIEAFRGVRYDISKVGSLSNVCAPPYDVIDEGQKRSLLAASPYNSVRLILPDDRAGQDRFTVAAHTLRDWIRSGVLVAEDKASIYPYRMEYLHPRRGPQVITGVIASVSLDSRYKIVPHERTMSRPKEEQMRLLASTHANLSPVYLLVVPTQKGQRGISTVATADWPLLETCTEPPGVKHSLYKIDDPGVIEELQGLVENDILVIADGHHRIEVARSFWHEFSLPGSDRIMAFVVDLDEATHGLQGTHRIIKSPRLDVDSFEKLFADTFFSCEKVNPNLQDLHSFLEEGRVVLLVAKKAPFGDGVTLEALASMPLRSPEATDHLAASSSPYAVVHDSLLESVSPQDVTFEPSLETALQAVGEGRADAAVLLPPPSLETVTALARSGSLLPQKSTYFYPKPRTGSVFRLFDVG